MDFPLEKEKNIFSKSRQNTWQNQNYSLAQLMTKRSLKIPIKPNSEEKHPMKPPRWRVAKKIRKNRWKLYSMTMFSFRGCMSSQKKTQDWSNIKQKKKCSSKNPFKNPQVGYMGVINHHGHNCWVVWVITITLQINWHRPCQIRDWKSTFLSKWWKNLGFMMVYGHLGDL